ncbi:MAG TPA: cytochrome c [Stellaceae bacterium]|jgi:cytochrome c556|nr:cytochrome c [Stellaceae bacterium]
MGFTRVSIFAVPAVLIVLLGAGPALAQAANEKVMQERQALMKQQGADMGAVKGYLDDKNDLAKASAAAVDLSATMKKIPDVFPPNTAGPNPDGKYETKPEVWSDNKGFLEQRDIAAKKVEALQVALKGADKAAIQTAFGELGKEGCGGCHQKFRAEIKK